LAPQQQGLLGRSGLQVVHILKGDVLDLQINYCNYFKWLFPFLNLILSHF
jgi:hypothetical protein